MIKLPARGRVLLKKPETEETMPGGLIVIPESSRNKIAANQFEILDVGAPEFCSFPDDCDQLVHKFLTLKDCVHPIDERIKKGAWCVVRPRALVDAGDDTYLVRQTDVLAILALSAAQTIPEDLPKDCEGEKKAVA